MNVLDLFSGIGGFSLALERTGGFKTRAFCEMDLYRRRVLAKHWPEVPCYHDVTKLTGDILERDGIAADVITGGFPCQDISIAGKAAGIAGERSGLWRDIARLTDEIKPKYLIIENSRYIRSRGLDAVLGDLSALRYGAEWHCIPASHAGACHQRDRLWLVAYPEEVGPIWWGRSWPGSQEEYAGLGCGELWQRRSQPRPVGVLDGVRNRVDRIAALGDTIVPQIPTVIGRAILASENQR